MAGFFGIGDYTKPGKGVNKDDPEKNAFFLFFELYFRKFWKLIQANLLYFVSCIPFLILSGLFVTLLVRSSAAETLLSSYLFYLSLIPLVGVAVMTPGLAFLMRNFVREEPVFLWSDFKDAVVKNWKQSLAVGLIDYAAFFILTVSVNFYAHQSKTSSIYLVPLVLCLMVAILLVFMQYYLFLMMVTFYLSLRQLLKNAALFAMAGFLRNLFLTIVIGLLVLLNYVIPPVLLLLPFLGLSTVGFLVSFVVWPKIAKFMLPQKDEGEETDDSIFEDKGKQ